MKFLNESRKEYTQFSLDTNQLEPDPFDQFSTWFNVACNHGGFEANAMHLSTISKANAPSNRVVLMKAFDRNGFVFFTNYNSQKALDMSANSAVSLSFFWPVLEQQIHISGHANKTSHAVSDAYFLSRPRDAQLAAWASMQSEPISSRNALEKKMAHYRSKFQETVPRPNFWGGYTVVPNRFEFWQGRKNRFHDRMIYTKHQVDWAIVRLCP